MTSAKSKMIPIVDRWISIPANQSLINTATILLDSVSANSFNNLKLEVTGIYNNKDSLKILKVNLRDVLLWLKTTCTGFSPARSFAFPGKHSYYSCF